MLVEPQRTNIFPQDLSGAGVVTRTITVANATVYSVSVEGTGSMALSGAGTGTVSEGSPVTFTSSSTSLTLTLTGSLDYCQVEVGAYPTSIIFTELVQETRNADVIQKTGISSLLGDSAGTLFIEASFFEQGLIGVSDGTTNNRYSIGRAGSGRFLVFKGGVSQADINGGATNLNTYYKLAARMAINNAALYINGASIGTDTSVEAIPDGTLNIVQFNAGGPNPFYGRIRTLAVYDYALDNTELANITTP